MKFLDANIFLRFLVAPVTPQDVRMQDASERLFEAIEAGHEEATTSELIVHEVFYILCSKREYGIARDEAVAMMRPLLALNAMQIPRKRLLLDAIDLFEEHRFLDFPDALSIVTTREDGQDLVSFDRGLSRVPGVTRLEP